MVQSPSHLFRVSNKSAEERRGNVQRIDSPQCQRTCSSSGVVKEGDFPHGKAGKVLLLEKFALGVNLHPCILRVVFVLTGTLQRLMSHTSLPVSGVVT